MSVDLHYFSQTSLCLLTTENNAGFNSPQQNTSVEYCICIEAFCCGKFYPHRIDDVANKTKSAIKKAKIKHKNISVPLFVLDLARTSAENRHLRSVRFLWRTSLMFARNKCKREPGVERVRRRVPSPIIFGSLTAKNIIVLFLFQKD